MVLYRLRADSILAERVCRRALELNWHAPINNIAKPKVMSIANTRKIILALAASTIAESPARAVMSDPYLFRAIANIITPPRRFILSVSEREGATPKICAYDMCAAMDDRDTFAPLVPILECAALPSTMTPNTRAIRIDDGARIAYVDSQRASRNQHDDGRVFYVHGACGNATAVLTAPTKAFGYDLDPRVHIGVRFRGARGDREVTFRIDAVMTSWTEFDFDSGKVVSSGCAMIPHRGFGARGDSRAAPIIARDRSITISRGIAYMMFCGASDPYALEFWCISLAHQMAARLPPLVARDYDRAEFSVSARRVVAILDQHTTAPRCARAFYIGAGAREWTAIDFGAREYNLYALCPSAEEIRGIIVRRNMLYALCCFAGRALHAVVSFNLATRKFARGPLIAGTVGDMFEIERVPYPATL